MILVPTFFQARSGSTLTDLIIDQHPDICGLAEVYHGQRYNTPISKNLTKSNFLKFDQSAKNKIKLFKDVKNFYVFQYSCADMILFDTELNYQKNFKFINDHFGQLVYIRRNNLLKRLVSYQKSLHNNVWHLDKNLLDNADNKINLSITMNDDYLYSFVRSTIHNKEVYQKPLYLYNFLKKYSVFEYEMLNFAKSNIPTVLEIVYEDDIENDPLVAVNKITDFLNLKRYDQYEIPLQKTGKGLEEDLENYEEVYNHLKDTEFGWMLK